MPPGQWVFEHREICTKDGADEIIAEVVPDMLCVILKPNGELSGYDRTWRFQMSAPDMHGKRIVITYNWQRRDNQPEPHESGMGYAFYCEN
jgi:hypothetical protein